MVALKVNGWTVPVERAGLTFAEVGSFKRAFSGRQRRNLRSRKREWAVTTPSIPIDQALCLEGVLRQHGERFPFDGDYFSVKGRPPTVAAPGGAFNTTTAKFGYSLECQAPATNLLASNVATCGDTGVVIGTIKPYQHGEAFGATYGGSIVTLTRDTSKARHGTGCLKVALSGSGGFNYFGVKTAVTGLTSGATYTWTFYGDGNANVGCLVKFSNGSEVSYSGNPSFLDGTLKDSAGWTRRSLTFTVPSGVTSCELRQHENTWGSGYNWYIDSFMLNVGSTAPSWVDGANTGLGLAYDISRHVAPTPPVMAVNAWVNSPGTAGTVFTLVPSVALYPRVKLFYNGSNTWYVSVWNDAGAQTNYLGSASATGWRMLTAILKSGPTQTVRLLADGIDVITPAAYTGTLSFSQLTRLQIGNQDGGSQFIGFLDEVSFYNYPLADSFLVARAAATRGLPTVPHLYCEGDLIGGRFLYAVAKDVSVDHESRSDGAGGWLTNAGKVSFNLVEV